MRVLTAHRAAIRDIVYGPDGGTLYGFGWGRPRDGLHVWQLGEETGRAELRYVERRVWGCWPLPDGRLLLGVARKERYQEHRGEITLATSTGGLTSLPLDLLLCSVAITVHPTGDRFVSTDRSVFNADIKCHRLEGGTAKELWRRRYERDYSVGSGVEYHPDGERVLSTETHQHPTTRVRTPVARWRSAADGAPLGDPIPLTVSTCLTRLLADGSRLIAMAGAALHSYDLANPAAKPKKATSGNRLHFTGMAVHPHGRRVLAICNDQTVREYDAVTMKQIRAYDWKVGHLRCLAIAPDGLTASAVGARRKVVVWDLE